MSHPRRQEVPIFPNYPGLLAGQNEVTYPWIEKMPIFPNHRRLLAGQGEMASSRRKRVTGPRRNDLLPNPSGGNSGRGRRIVALDPSPACGYPREGRHQVLMKGSIRMVAEGTAKQIRPRMSPASAGVNAEPASHFPYQLVPLSPVQSPAPRLLVA